MLWGSSNSRIPQIQICWAREVSQHLPSACRQATIYRDLLGWVTSTSHYWRKNFDEKSGQKDWSRLAQSIGLILKILLSYKVVLFSSLLFIVAKYTLQSDSWRNVLREESLYFRYVIWSQENKLETSRTWLLRSLGKGLQNSRGQNFFTFMTVKIYFTFTLLLSFF